MTESEFIAALETHKGILYKVSRMYVDDIEDQQDLFQEIMVQLWKALPSFKGESKFSSWMYRVAINTAIVFFKKDKKRKTQINQFGKEDLITQEYDESKDQQLAHFYKAVKELNKLDKALILQYLEGLPGREIAQNLGLTEVNVRVKTNRAKRKLQEIIKKQGYEF